MVREKAIRELEDLPGIGEASTEKLKSAGITTLESVAVLSPHELSEISGINVEAAKKAIAAAKSATHIEYETAAAVSKKREELGKITTNSKNLNELIGGGVETNAITEVYGKFASGKTQIGFQLAVNVQLPKNKGGLDGSCLFIDTEGTFRPERIKDMAEGSGLKESEVLEKIIVVRAPTTDKQVLTAERADKIIEEHNIKLIIVDSMMSLFRSEFIGRGSLGERQQKLNTHVHQLQRLADKYNIAIYITNQVMDNPGILFGDPTTPVGGNILAHAATTRLYIRKSKEEKRIVRLVDSPSMPDGECIIKITTKGVSD
jgi:DNA repair and recombination protein RadA